MTRGNQRETDRQRAAKRAGKPTAKDKDGLSALQRKERDAQALQEKLAKKAQSENKAKDNAK
ncbi:TPA: hypothetical protein ACH3X1_007681 [Trebouxia sp. C0004]